MDLFQPRQSPTDFIQSNTLDPAKHEAIASKLCAKRMTLEAKLSDTSLDSDSRENHALDLIQIKEDLSAFGISEIDYQAYVLKNAAAKSTSDESLTVLHEQD